MANKAKRNENGMVEIWVSGNTLGSNMKRVGEYESLAKAKSEGFKYIRNGGRAANDFPATTVAWQGVDGNMNFEWKDKY